MDERIAVVGLGYVGLPVALAFAKRYPHTVGFDLDARRVEALRRGVDTSSDVSAEALRGSSLECTTNPAAMREATFFVVAVPTPIDADHRPDLGPVIGATEERRLRLEARRGRRLRVDGVPGGHRRRLRTAVGEGQRASARSRFHLGYSPERINPGDPSHRFETIVKVVAGEDADTLERVARAYESVVTAGVYRARSSAWPRPPKRSKTFSAT